MIRNAFGLTSEIVEFTGDNTGNVDVVDLVEDFIEAHPGKMVQLGEGTYKFSRALDPNASVLLRGVSAKTTVIKYPKTTPAIHTLNNWQYQLDNSTQMTVTSISTGIAPDGFAETTDSDKVQTLIVSGTIDTTKFKVGGSVALSVSDLHPAAGDRRLGEVMKIRYVDVANSTIYLEGMLAQGASVYATSIRVNTILEDRDCHISHIGFTADGEWDDISIDSPASLHNHAIVLMGIPYAHIHDLEFDQLWEGAIQVSDCCPFTIVENIFGRHIPNLMTGVTYTLGTDPFSTDTATNNAGSTDITVQQTGHPWKVGNTVTISALTTGTYNGVASSVIKTRQTVKSITADSFTFTVVGTASATGSFGGTSGRVSQAGRLGYGISVGNLNTGIIVRHCVFHESRHGFTTDGHGDSTYTAAEWIKYGQCTHVLFEDCHVRNAYGPAFDTHEEGAYISFIGCSNTNPTMGNQGGSYKAYGMHLRCSGPVRVEGYRQYGGQYGIRVHAMSTSSQAIERFAGAFISIKDCTVEGLYSTSDVHPTTANSTLEGATARNSAFLVDDMTDVTNPPIIFIDGFDTDNVNQSLLTLGGAVKIYARDFDAKRNGVPLEVMAGTKLIFTGPSTFNFIGTARTPTELNVCHMWAQNADKVTGTGSEVIFLVKPNVLKDSAAKPVNFFKEMDTVANKTYYADGIAEYNIGAVTKTVLVSAGATTMVQATNINELGIPALALKDIGTAFKIDVKSVSTLTTNRTLTLAMQDANTTLTLSADATLGGVNTGNGVLPDYTTTNPTTPSSGLQAFARFRAGLRKLALIGPSGLVKEMQSNLASKKIQGIMIAGGGSATVTGLGMAGLTETGTAASPGVTWASILGMMKRRTYTTAGIAAQSCGAKTNGKVARGSAAGCGGFESLFRWTIESVHSSHASFAGFDPSTADIGDVNPSSLVNMCGFGADAGDTNMQWMVNDGSGTATKVDLGANFPAKTAGVIYEGRIFCKPNDTVLYYSLERIDTAFITEGSSNSDLPTNTVGICFGVHGGTRADVSTTVSTVGLSTYQVETEY